jgi:putative tryptophan/tyrosine transport system substrate-binding protein
MEAAKVLGREIVVQGVRQNTDLEKAFAIFAEGQVDAITVATDTILAYRSQALVEFAARYKVPAVYGEPFIPRRGGLMSYSAVINDV